MQNASILATGYLLVNPLNSVAVGPKNSIFMGGAGSNTIPVLHTSNMHGRLNPFSFGQLNGIGGMFNIQSVVEKTNNAITVDAGGFLNSKSGLDDHFAMVRQMNKTGYTAVTIGEEELAKGEEHLAALVEHMDFTVVNCNYTFSHPVLKAKVLPYQIVRYGDYKVGITGVGLVYNLKNIHAANPYKRANEVAAYLKNRQRCDLVICLSTLGFMHQNSRHDNKKFAAASTNIDVIIGGHNTDIYHPQVIAKNSTKQQVVISNGGYGGSIVGSLHFTFNEEKNLQAFNCKNYIPGRDKNGSFYEGFKQLTA